MSKNKSLYAAKHSDFKSKDIIASEAFIAQNKDLFEVMKNPHEFEKNFLQLKYPRQIALLELFDKITNGKLVISPRQIKQTLLDLTYKELEKIHWLTNSCYEEGNAYFPIADDEKKLVRMECYGTINARRKHELSPYYKFFRKKENLGTFRLKDYDLSDSPMWRVFNQFESFRSIALRVRRHLYKKGINPDALKIMSVNDFCDVIHEIYAKNKDSMKARFLETGYKNKFVMNFMRHCGKDFEKHLLNRGLDERKAKSLCRMMRQYGLCDIDRVIITEINYTQKVLDDLKAHHYDVSKFKVGDPIPEKIIDEVFTHNQEHLLLAYDENGHTLNKDDMPRFEVHHKNAVKFAHSGDYLAKVNYNSNLMLVEKEMHRAYYHIFDYTVQVNYNNERFFSRLNTPVAEMCMINGFNPNTDIFFYDLENNAFAQRRARTDSQNVVNYYEMQFERLNNIPEIASKYNIGYSKIDLNNEYKSLQELTKFKVNIPAQDLKFFEELFAPNLQKRKHKKMNKKNASFPKREIER